MKEEFPKQMAHSPPRVPITFECETIPGIDGDRCDRLSTNGDPTASWTRLIPRLLEKASNNDLKLVRMFDKSVIVHSVLL
jgi:hypothetical protein